MNPHALYYQDPYCQHFSAQVLTCAPADAHWLVTLDRTAFYPEGGGQPADHGTMNGIPVLDVQERDGVIFHTVEQPVERGTQVSCQLDWARRFDHMQQHAGEHILSGILCREYHCDNVGFHLGAETVTIDYNRELTWDQVLAAEQTANAVIWSDCPIETDFPTPDVLIPLDYRSKKELSGPVRIVTVPGADCCACCGTHPARSGEVGLVKVLSCQKFREGVRLEILCGERALRYLSATYDQARAIGQALSVKPVDAFAAVERMAEELTQAKQRMTELEDQVFSSLSAQYEGAGDVLLFQPPIRPDGVRKLADALAKRCGGRAAVFAGAGDQYTYAVIRADGGDITPFVKALNAALHGRGGGRNGFAQGRCQATEAEIRSFFQV